MTMFETLFVGFVLSLILYNILKFFIEVPKQLKRIADSLEESKEE